MGSVETSPQLGISTLPILNTEPDKHEQWLEKRRQFIGGSDSASLFPEESKYGCDVRLFFDKQGKRPDYQRSQREEDILKRGHVWESVVANYFAEETGLKIRRQPARISKEFPMMGVNMDRQIIGVTTDMLKKLWPDYESIQQLEGECGPGYLECKTTNEWEFKRMLAEGVTVDYIFQVNHGLVVTNYRWGVFAVLEPTWGQFATFPVVFMPSLGEEQARRAEAFWKVLQAGEIPQPKVNDKRCKSCLYRRSCPRSAQLLAEAGDEWTKEGYEVVDTPELVELVSDYRAAEAEADEKAATVEEIKRRIKIALGATVEGDGEEEKFTGGKERIEIPSCGVRISWTIGKPPQRWDSKALEGTVKDLSRYQFPEHVACEFCAAKNDAEGNEAVLIVCDLTNGSLHYACEPCGMKAGKGGGSLVARKDVSAAVANCKRPGTPSRPFKFMQL